MVEGTPPGDALPPPPQRATQARKGARCGASAGSPRPHRPTRDTRVAEPWLPAPDDRRPGEGQCLTPDTPHNGGRLIPPKDGPPPPSRHAAPTGHAGEGDSAWPPHPHTRAHSTWVADRNSRPSGRAVGGGRAPDLRCPSQWWKAPSRGRLSATPTASNAGPQRRTLWGRCWVPPPAPTAPGTHGSRNSGCPLQRTGGRGSDSARHQTPLTTVAGHPPRGRPSTTPAARSPHRACRPRGQCWAPTPRPPRPQRVVGGPQQPNQWAGSRGRDSA